MLCSIAKTLAQLVYQSPHVHLHRANTQTVFAWKREVAGSNPAARGFPIPQYQFPGVAQSVEHLTNLCPVHSDVIRASLRFPSGDERVGATPPLRGFLAPDLRVEVIALLIAVEGSTFGAARG